MLLPAAPLTASGIRRALAWSAVALGACTLLALRAVAGAFTERRLDAEFFVTGFGLQAAWVALYYLTWVILTPFVFLTARWLPFERGRMVRALVFHLPVSVAVSSVVFTLLSVLFGAVVLGYGWPSASEVLEPFWTRALAARAATDTLTYWVVLGAGHALRLYDDDWARSLRAAELERSLVAAQVESLRMKLQPHFLFNTLNSISFLAIERDARAVVAMVERLASLLRASTSSSGRQLVPLDEELTLLDQYLAIEELRFKDRLRVARRIDPAARDARLPSLVLQPIVENSIKHGFSRRLDASRLEIAVRCDGAFLIVEVFDDGPGVPEGWDLATHCGRGLRNVLQRLDALYRGAWTFTLENAPGGGAMARLRIPFRAGAATGGAAGTSNGR